MERLVLVDKVADYVIRLMEDLLPSTLYFHNLSHTMDVVYAVSEIGENLRLSESELDILKTAAWFHDCGHLYAYVGHEDISKIIAETYLIQQFADRDLIDKVLACINATKTPQKPRNIMQQIICDADFYHLTLKEYGKKAQQLKRELGIYLQRFYSDPEWNNLNLTMLQNHKYFTIYADSVWQPLKLKNIGLLKCDFDNFIY